MGGYGVPSVDIPDAGMPVGAGGSVISGITSGSMVTTVIFGSMTMPSMEGGDISADESDDMLISVDLRNIVSVTYDANSNGIPEMDIGIGDYSENILNGTQFGLSVVTIGGLFFGPPGLVFSSVAGAANGLISMARGNYVSGGIGVALAALPLIGMLGKIGMVGEGIAQFTSEGNVFWSGGRGTNRIAAEAFALSSGKTTLEMTTAGQQLEQIGGNISQWRELSASFAKNATGEVDAFVAGSRYNSVWNTIEKPALMSNPNVNKIIFHDIINTAKTSIIYK